MSDAIETYLSNAEIVLSVMKPFEVEKVTGLSADMQRTWRNRGYLQKEKGQRATYEISEVASLIIAVAISENGIAPSEALTIGERYWLRIFQLALIEAKGTIEAVGPRVDVNRLHEAASKQWTNLVSKISSSDCERGPNFLISIDGQPYFGDTSFSDLDSATEELSIHIINLVSAGRRLGRRFPLPLVTIRLPHQGGPESPITSKILGEG